MSILWYTNFIVCLYVIFISQYLKLHCYDKYWVELHQVSVKKFERVLTNIAYITQVTHFSELSDLCDLCTKVSDASSLLLDNCDIPERLEEDMSSFERFLSNLPITFEYFFWDMIYLK